MRGYLLSRLAWAGPIVFCILVINFLIIHVVPGDPIQALVGDFPTPPGYIEQIRHEFGLDQPISTQLGLYLLNLAEGNLGFSFANRQPVLGLVLDRARFTLLLMLQALTAAAILGVVLALAAAPRAGSLYDSGITALSLIGFSVPIFWLGQILVIVFAIKLRWLPAQGMISLRDTPTGWAAVTDVLWHLILPAFSVTIYYVAIVARVARASVLDAMSQDFVLTAKAKGLSRRYVLWRHVLPNALIPVVTVIGYNFGYSLTGAILVETVFAWPGLGNLFITSIGNRDYPLLQGIFLLTAIAVVIANVVTDVLYAALDPRVRSSYGRNA
ncbi:MAG: ABC transporter permease [Proteobacteria bacterium]|nr:ABC transporter permease [Pseudomonadota bacterium]